MPVIELNEDIAENVIGKLQPRADQKRFTSTWAVLDGAGKELTGFPNARDLQSPQPFGHGSSRALSGYEPHKVPLPGGKGTKDHVVHLNGVPLVEMICDRESVALRDKWTAEVSRRKIDSIRQDELDRIDRLGLPDLKGDPENMRERLVKDDDLPETKT